MLYSIPPIMPNQTMRGHSDFVNGVVHLPGEQRIITYSLDGSLRLWNLESGSDTQIGEYWRDENEKLWSMALSPNGKIIASGSNNGRVRLWDVQTMKVIARWREHSRTVCALCWSTDGNRLASGSWDGTARIWDVDSGKTVLKIKTRKKWVRVVMYSPDSSKLAMGGDWANAVHILDAKTGKRLSKLKHDDVVCSLAWTSDGRKLISGSYGPIRIFDTATWQQIAILEGHTNFVTTISLSRNNNLLASVSFDETIPRLWNLDTNSPIGPPLQHEKPLRSAALSPDGKVLATACMDENVYIWDIYAILKTAGLEDLLSIDDSDIQHTSRSSLGDESVLDADATRDPDQFGCIDELSPTFFADFHSSDTHPHSSANTLLTRLRSLLHHFQTENVEAAEPHSTTPLTSRPDAFIGRLFSLFRFQPHTHEAIELTQHPSRPLVVEVAAVRDKQALNVARGPRFKKAKRAHEQQTQLHGQVLSSQTQLADTSTSATPPAPGTAAAQPPHISWWAHIVPFLCCVSPPHSNGS